MKTKRVLEVDATGLLCPLPVLRLRKRLRTLEAGQVARLVADDAAAVIDVPHFCTEAGHVLLKVEPCDTGTAFYVQKGQARGPAHRP